MLTRFKKFLQVEKTLHVLQLVTSKTIKMQLNNSRILVIQTSYIKIHLIQDSIIVNIVEQRKLNLELHSIDLKGVGLGVQVALQNVILLTYHAQNQLLKFTLTKKKGLSMSHLRPSINSIQYKNFQTKALSKMLKRSLVADQQRDLVAHAPTAKSTKNKCYG